MRMVSTRGGGFPGLLYTDVLLSGLAPDGGLYVPQTYPAFSKEELENLKDAPYEEIAFAIKSRLVDGAIPDKDLKELIASAYAPSVFEREKGTIVPVSEIDDGLFIENLSLGPTASFKDIALQLLGREMAYELKRRGERLVILGATSGDTGSAAEAAVKALPNITLFMLSPEKGMSDFQRAQMGEFSGGNVFNISIRGRFDDCQDLVKEVKRDPGFAHLGAVNSINWGRISAQVPYYFAGYFQVAQRIGDQIDIAVPSGNFGNIFAGYIAKRMGLPIRRLVVATNENNVLDTLFKTGVYAKKTAQVTSSPSMDISKASNYERLVFDIFDRDAERVKDYMETFNAAGTVSLNDYGVDASVFAEIGFESGTSTHPDRVATIKKTYHASDIIIDPHTADGVFVGEQKRDKDIPMLCMSTALPVKFEDTVREALGFVPERPKRFANIERSLREDAFTTMEPDSNSLKKFIVSSAV